MNNPVGRTISNKVKLRLKGFHRRIMGVVVVRSLFDCDVKPPPINPLGASSSGGRENVVGSFTYTLEELKATKVSVRGYGAYRIPQPYKKTFQWTFNKSQLIGKLIIVSGIRCRIKKN